MTTALHTSRRARAGTSRTAWAWAWARPLAGAAVLGAVVCRLGTGPFLDAAGTIDARSLAAGAGIAVLTTVCCAWRWCLVARGLGVPVPLRAAVGAYYRSQFLNTTLPGGVLGDVHRAVRHGRDTGEAGRCLRAVAWERAAGQVVQLVLAVAVLLLMPSPVRSSMPVVAVAVVAGAVAVLLLSRALSYAGRSVWARSARTALGDLNAGLSARCAWPGIVIASSAAVAGHVATFLVAARTAGSTAPVAELLPLGLLVLLATGIPANLAGWGPREGAAAWAFGAAGLGASAGIATAVVYGAMVLVANLPGGVVLLAGSFRGSARGDG